LILVSLVYTFIFLASEYSYGHHTCVPDGNKARLCQPIAIGSLVLFFNNLTFIN